MIKQKDTIAAVKIYVVKGFDAIDDVLNMIPEPWKEDHHDTCKIASSENKNFRVGWEVECWAKVEHGQTKEALEQILLDALGDKEWIVEDISRLKKEREIIAQIRDGLEKPNAEK